MHHPATPNGVLTSRDIYLSNERNGLFIQSEQLEKGCRPTGICTRDPPDRKPSPLITISYHCFPSHPRHKHFLKGSQRSVVVGYVSQLLRRSSEINGNAASPCQT